MTYSLRFIMTVLLAVAAFFLADIIPYEVRSLCYAISLSAKEVLVFTLPFIVFSVVFCSVSKLPSKDVLKATGLILLMVGLSNSASVGVAYFFGTLFVKSLQHEVVSEVGNSISTLSPMYNTFKLPHLISITKILALAFLSGIILPRILGERIAKVSDVFHSISGFLLEHVLANVLPLFVVGFTFKIRSDGAMELIGGNSIILLGTIALVLVYITFLYLLGSGFSFSRTLSSIKYMGPAALTGLVTMSSLATMPVTLSAVRRNTDNSLLSDVAVSGSVNIHLVGDCFFSVILLLFISSTFGTEVVTGSDYMYFLMYTVLLKFAEAAVAGTGLILMFPVMEQYLHFSPMMISIAATLYIFLDPIITAFNVLGNGAFSILFVRVNDLLSKKKMLWFS